MAAKSKITSLKKKTMGSMKKPTLKASQKSIDAWLKRKKEVTDHNKRVETELARRKKLLDK